MTLWPRRPHPIVLPGCGVSVHVNLTVGRVGERIVRRVFRTAIGDWAAELELDGKLQTEIFDHHPTIAMMRALQAGSVDIAREVIVQGAEGPDIRWEARRTRIDRTPA